jgi:hypothetical protein
MQLADLLADRVDGASSAHLADQKDTQHTEMLTYFYTRALFGR